MNEWMNLLIGWVEETLSEVGDVQAGGDDDEGELAGVHHPRVEADDGTLGAARWGGAARRGALHNMFHEHTNIKIKI